MAYKMFHRSITAGIALAGAGAIAFSAVPVLPANDVVIARHAVAADFYTAPAHRVVTTEIQNVALLRHLEILGAGAVAAVKESFGTFSDDIPALWNQLGISVEGGQWEDPDLLRLNWSLLANIVLAPIAPLVVGPFTDAVVEVLAQTFSSHGDEIREKLPQAIEYAFARVVGPIVSAVGALGVAHRAAYDAGLAGNPPGQWVAILGVPFRMIEGFLFGGYGDISALITGEVGGERIAAPGLLTPWGQYPEDRSVTDTFPDSAAAATRLVPIAVEATDAPKEIIAADTAETVTSPVAAEVVDEPSGAAVVETETPGAMAPDPEKNEAEKRGAVKRGAGKVGAVKHGADRPDADDADSGETAEKAKDKKNRKGKKDKTGNDEAASS